MNFYNLAFALLIKSTLLVSMSNGFYIKAIRENHKNKIQNDNTYSNKIDWSIFQQKLGLSNKKVELLKSQKDQLGTFELLNRFIKENPGYSNNKGKLKDISTTGTESLNSFSNVYENLLKQIKLSHSKLKTSLNFELADDPRKLKRSRRKIAVKMVSDMPSEKIDELLKMFNEKNGISKQDNEDDEVLETDEVYKGFSLNPPSSVDPDYVYENLYEDEEDLGAAAKSKHNSQYGSFQDLILQATRHQWQREMQETKLRNRNNEHFI